MSLIASIVKVLYRYKQFDIICPEETQYCQPNICKLSTPVSLVTLAVSNKITSRFASSLYRRGRVSGWQADRLIKFQAFKWAYGLVIGLEDCRFFAQKKSVSQSPNGISEGFHMGHGSWQLLFTISSLSLLCIRHHLKVLKSVWL